MKYEIKTKRKTKFVFHKFIEFLLNLISYDIIYD